MDETPVDAAARQSPAPQEPRNRLLERATRERWEIQRQRRRPLIDRLDQIVHDVQGVPPQALSGAREMLSASKINLGNIVATIKADKHTELEQRMREIEQILEAQKAREAQYSNSWSK